MRIKAATVAAAKTSAPMAGPSIHKAPKAHETAMNTGTVAAIRPTIR